MRNAMATESDGRADADAALRRVDAFVKAYYVPWGPELRRWALSHPEVGRPAVAAVVAAVGEAAGVARRARAAFGAALDAELAAWEIGHRSCFCFLSLFRRGGMLTYADVS
jgi:hypothetical protein